MRHKHAELIKAWADGAEIEYRFIFNPAKPLWSVWKTKINDGWSDSDNYEYRIKPEPVRVFREVPLNGGYILRFYPSDTGWMCGISNEMMDAIEEAYK